MGNIPSKGALWPYVPPYDTRRLIDELCILYVHLSVVSDDKALSASNVLSPKPIQGLMKINQEELKKLGKNPNPPIKYETWKQNRQRRDKQREKEKSERCAALMEGIGPSIELGGMCVSNNVSSDSGGDASGCGGGCGGGGS
uniref:Uncharacterized protein n=1 Tax=Kwoniella bestiolae CBS 10118 TaxID=1296100 RepID=A0A1B9G0K6_9TREE|nr:hypothetical protein I302_06008 [Kwoniella bestiolae CBS 10118]OCF24547.1 hypothetical protein I302_06008 [Kwoniella bestiolae CBS 10118]